MTVASRMGAGRDVWRRRVCRRARLGRGEQRVRIAVAQPGRARGSGGSSSSDGTAGWRCLVRLERVLGLGRGRAPHRQTHGGSGRRCESGKAGGRGAREGCDGRMSGVRRWRRCGDAAMWRCLSNDVWGRGEGGRRMRVRSEGSLPRSASSESEAEDRTWGMQRRCGLCICRGGDVDNKHNGSVREQQDNGAPSEAALGGRKIRVSTTTSRDGKAVRGSLVVWHCLAAATARPVPSPNYRFGQARADLFLRSRPHKRWRCCHSAEHCDSSFQLPRNARSSARIRRTA